ncbi:MAG TPA: exodeoxyribonuclease VII large subunit [Streptosporangiaceae bacterium]|nr:exodeoxyribonuclease VII large subunit [Streptosporangiaceae bacterium]
MPLETSAEAPIPVRTALRLVGDWIGKLGRVWVEGQIAELSKRGGAVFLTLRDPVAAASVRVVCPRAVFENADPEPANGARVVVWVKPDFSMARGSFSLSAIELRAVGVGELLARLDRLRRSLAAEGLFAPERKRRPPFLPHKIGLICGRDSAAERDVLQNAARRWPAVRFRVEQVAVQGPFAVEEVTAALQVLDADDSVDVIVIARGGGSIEDLLPFSDETLIRAVAGCRTPVVSAIGHEQDVPLLDLVADVRASTPTDAARKVVPDIAEQLAIVTELRSRARRQLAGRLDRESSWLTAVRSRPALASPAAELDRRQEQVLALAERARRCLSASLDRAGADIGHTRARLIALSPAATLRRGYAIVQREDATVVRSAKDVIPDEKLLVRFAADQLSVTVSKLWTT